MLPCGAPVPRRYEPPAHKHRDQSSTSPHPNAALPLHDTSSAQPQFCGWRCSIDQYVQSRSSTHPPSAPIFITPLQPAVMDASDIVTLDNLAEKLPPWNLDGEDHIYAVVDMGRCGMVVLSGFKC